jgi:mRNA interferase RelE/StbE
MRGTTRTKRHSALFEYLACFAVKNSGPLCPIGLTIPPDPGENANAWNPSSSKFQPAPNVIYKVEFKPRALKDLKGLPATESARIVVKAEALKDDLAGDVKRLTNFTPEYRLRVGNYRILFEVEGASVVVYRVRHRKDAYK